MHNVGPTSKTLGQRCINDVQMFRVCWDVAPLLALVGVVVINRYLVLVLMDTNYTAISIQTHTIKKAHILNSKGRCVFKRTIYIYIAK